MNDFVYVIGIILIGMIVWRMSVELRNKTDKEKTPKIKNESITESQRAELPKSNLQDKAKIQTESTPTLPKTMPKKEPTSESVPEKTKKIEQEHSEKPEDVQSEPVNQELSHLKEIQNLLEELRIIKQEISDYEPPKRKTKKSSKTREKPTYKIKK